MSTALEKRTWFYLQPPKVYEMSPCPKCGNIDVQWSEYAKHLWCAVCEIDYIPEQAGIFDGPIPVHAAAMMGVSFDIFNLETARVERFNLKTMKHEPQPKRIQRKRTKGYKLPEGVIYVGRPTRYGNPYWHVQRFHGLELSLALYKETAQGVWMPSLLDGMPESYVQQVYQRHLDWTSRFGRHPLEAIRSELKGRDLACWCAESAKCHADILLRLANA